MLVDFCIKFRGGHFLWGTEVTQIYGGSQFWDTLLWGCHIFETPSDGQRWEGQGGHKMTYHFAPNATILTFRTFFMEEPLNPPTKYYRFYPTSHFDVYLSKIRIA